MSEAPISAYGLSGHSNRADQMPLSGVKGVGVPLNRSRPNGAFRLAKATADDIIRGEQYQAGDGANEIDVMTGTVG